jgi:hypothetical protein
MRNFILSPILRLKALSTSKRLRILRHDHGKIEIGILMQNRLVFIQGFREICRHRRRQFRLPQESHEAYESIRIGILFHIEFDHADSSEIPVHEKSEFHFVQDTVFLEFQTGIEQGIHASRMDRSDIHVGKTELVSDFIPSKLQDPGLQFRRGLFRAGKGDYLIGSRSFRRQ